jgi:hypothetical protein
MKKDKDFQEPEEKEGKNATTDIPDSDMLTSEPVIDRSHTGGTGTGPTVNEWSPPPFNAEDFVTPDEDNETSEFSNAALKDASEGDKLEAGKEMARAGFELLDVILRETGNRFLLFRRKKLEKMHADGEINLNLRLYYRDGSSETVDQATERFNEAARDVAALDEDYKEEGAEVFGPMLAKKGLGFTRAQSFGIVRTSKQVKKIVQKFAGMYSIKSEMIEALKEQTANPNQSYTPPNPGPQAAAQPQQAQPYQPDQQEQETTQPVYHGEPEEQIHEQPVTQQPDMVQGMDDIQSNRGTGIIHEEYMPQHLKPVASSKFPGTGGNKKRSRKATAKKKSAVK